MKTMIIALSAAALIAAAPSVFAQGVSSKTSGLHQVSKKHHPGGYALWRQIQAKSSKKGFPGAFGYAPGKPSGSNREDIFRQAGGGGGSGM